MKPMKFFKRTTFPKFFTSQKSSSKFEYTLIFAVFVTSYDGWHQPINWSSIEILIKINLGKALKLNSPDTLWSLYQLKNFMGFMMI